MKTYTLASLNNLRKFNKMFDIATNITNKTWQIVDDENNKIFIYFKTDATFVIAENDKTAAGNWQSDSATKELKLIFADKTITTKPMYYDNVILELEISGANGSLILFDTNNNLSFNPTNLNQVNEYCEYKLNSNDPIRQNAAMANKIRKAENLKTRVEEIADQCDTYPLKKYSIISASALIVVLLFGIYYLCWGKPYYKELGISLLIIPVVIGGILWGFFDTQRWQTAVKNMVMYFRDNDEPEIINQIKTNSEFKGWFLKNYDFDPSKIKNKPSMYD